MPHHIVQRGHNRKAVFVEAGDYRYYLHNLREWKLTLGVKVYSYCLMTNHVHLIVEPGDDVTTVSRLMKQLAARQTRWVNKQEGRSGSLWEGRYKSSPIQRDCYLLQCCRYVERNPVKARMV
ncbi:MAG: transposase, partial [Coleofasciculus sp. C2-GNP5-27]